MPKPLLRVIRGVRQRTLSPEDALAFKGGLALLVRQHPAAAELLPELVAEVDRETTQSDRWDFTMINPAQLAAATAHMRTKAKRLRVSLAVWEILVQNLDRATGAILLTRDEIALQCGKPINHVSAAMAELVAWNVLRKIQQGRQAVWLFNANIGTRLPGKAGEVARRQAGPVLAFSRDAARIEDDAQEDLPL